MEEKEKDLDNGSVIQGKGTYIIEEKIGQGGFGKIYRVNEIKAKKLFALKILLEEKCSEKNIKDFENEIEILKKLYTEEHSYVLKIYDFCIIPINDNNNNRNFFVVDYAEKGDLLHYIKNSSNGFGEKYAKIIFKKILEGIRFCHEKNICHLDIKAANILLDDQYNPIINDFGLSRKIKDKDEKIIQMNGIRGTRFIRCPQMFEEQSTYNGIDADIFSLGTLLYFIVLKGRGFLYAEHKSYDDIKNKNYAHYWERFTYSEELSQEFKDLYLKMVAYEPIERPSLNDILNDPWLKEINIMLEKDLEKYKSLEKEFNDYLIGIEKKIKEMNEEIIESPKMIEEEKGNANPLRGYSSDENKVCFGENVRPKKMTKKNNYKYFIKMNGYINANKFMNSLVEKIIRNYKDECTLELSKKYLKFEITFENEEEEERECTMEIKLFEYNEEEYLLCFKKKQGDLEEFYDNFLIIKKIIKNMIK